jgi:hypothetical protein
MGFFIDIINDARRPSAAAFAESSGPPATAEEWASPAAGVELMAESAPLLREGVEPAALVPPSGEAREGRQPIGPVRQTMPPAIKDNKGPTEFVVAYSSPAGPETVGHHSVQAAADAPVANRITPGRDAGTASKCSAAVAVVKDAGQALSAAVSPPVEPEKREAEYGREDEYGPRTRTTDKIRSLRNAESGTGDADQAALGPQDSTAARNAVASREVPKVSVESRLATPAPAATEIPPGPRLLDVRQATAADSGPRVHIGRIDIVVLAPEPARHAQPSMTAPADLANRLYLRRL